MLHDRAEVKTFHPFKASRFATVRGRSCVEKRRIGLRSDAVQMIIPTFLYAALNEEKDESAKTAQPFNESAHAGNGERRKPNG